MRSEKRRKTLEALQEVWVHAKSVTKDDAGAFRRYAVITDFTGSQKVPRGFAIAIVDIGEVGERFASAAIHKVYWKSPDSTLMGGSLINFIYAGKRLMLLPHDYAQQTIQKLKGE